MSFKKEKCLCNNCSRHCCSNKFTGLAGNLRKDNDDRFVQIMLDNNEIKRIEDAGYSQLIEKIGDDYYLALNEDNSCKAFKDGLCTIYNVRPDVCKLYPYYFDPFCGLTIDKNCPGNFDLEKCDKIEIYNILEKRFKLFKNKECH